MLRICYSLICGLSLSQTFQGVTPLGWMPLKKLKAKISFKINNHTSMWKANNLLQTCCWKFCSLSVWGMLNNSITSLFSPSVKQHNVIFTKKHLNPFESFTAETSANTTLEVIVKWFEHCKLHSSNYIWKTQCFLLIVIWMNWPFND